MVHSTGKVAYITEDPQKPLWEVGIEVEPPEECIRVFVELPESASGLEAFNAQSGPFPSPCVVSFTVKAKPGVQVDDTVSVEFAFATDIA